MAECGIIDLMSSLSATEPKVEHAEQDAKTKRGIRFGIKSMFLGKKKGEEDKMSRTSSHGSLEKNPPSGSNTKLWKSDDVLNDEPKRETSPTKSVPSEPPSKETEMPTEEDHEEEMESKVPEMLGESAYELSSPLKSNLNESQRTIIGARSIDTVSPTKGELPKIASRPQVRASSDDVRKSGNTSGPPSPVRSEQELAHYNKNRPKPKRMQSTPIDEVSHPAESRAEHTENSNSVDKNDSPRSASPQNMSPSSLSRPVQDGAEHQKVADSVQPAADPPTIVSTPSQLLDSHTPSITARQVGGANAALASIMMQDFKRKSEGLKDLPAITRRPDGPAARPMSYHPGLSSEKVPFKAPRPVSVSFDKSESSVLLPEQSEALPAIDSAPDLASPEVETTFKGKEEQYREELAQKARLAASAEHKKAPVIVQPAASVLQFKKKINSTSGDDQAQEKVNIIKRLLLNG